jgi:hypothetical protein
LRLLWYFKDAQGTIIHEEKFDPVHQSSFCIDDCPPLKPGYIWQMERGKFYKAESVPTEWKAGAAEAKITDIEVAK